MLINPRYRLDALERLDANIGVFFARQLEAQRPEVFDLRYPELKGRTFVPINGNISTGAESYAYRMFDQVGQAKIVRDYARDFPRVGLKGAEARTPIVSIGDSYGWSIQEMRAAQLARLNLDMRLANTARFVIEQKIDELLLVGDADVGIEGLFTLSGVTTYTPPADGTGSTKTWSTKTTAQILRDLFGISNAIFSGTNEVELPDTLILPTSRYGVASTTKMGDADTRTILQAWQAAEPRIRTVLFSGKLETAGASGTARMVAYKRDPTKLEGIVPQEFEDFPPEWESMHAKVACHARCGGVVAYFPKSIAYADGI